MNETPIECALFEDLPLFASLDRAQLERMIASTRAIDLTEGERLFAQGQSADYFYLVVSGLMKLSRISGDGHEKIVTLVSPGRLFGEAILFLQQQRFPVDAAALEQTRLYGFHTQTYRDLLEQSTDLCLALCSGLSRRLHELIEEIDRLSLQNASLRVINYLIGLMPRTDHTTVEIDLGAAKHVIAARLSITPETLSRVLRTLSDQRVISINGKTVNIHDVPRLRALGHQNSTP